MPSTTPNFERGGRRPDARSRPARPHHMWSPGNLCVITGLKSSTELNDCPACIVSRDTKRERWNVLVDGSDTKKKSVSDDNLAPDNEALEAEGAPPEIVSVGKQRDIVGVVTARRGSNLILVESIDGKSPPAWVYLADDGANSAASVAFRLAVAEEEVTPTDFLAGARVLACDSHGRGGPTSYSDATVQDTRQDPTGRLHVYVEWDNASRLRARGLWLSTDEVRPCETIDDDDEDAFEQPAASSGRASSAAGKKGKKAAAASEAKGGGKASSSKSEGKKRAAAAPSNGKGKGKEAAAAATQVSSRKRKVAIEEEEGGMEVVEEEGDDAFESAPPAAKAPKRGKGGKGGKASSGGGGSSNTGPSRAELEAAKAMGMEVVKEGGGGEGGGASWRKKNRTAADVWEAALDAMQPEEDGEDGDAPAPAAPPAPAQPARDPRMQGFRIGGQAETAAERGEGWCGPWSTATRLIEQREAARLEREQNLPDGQELAPLQRWEPRRDPTRAPPRKTTNSFTHNKKALISGQARDNSGVPALQDLCVSFLVKHIDAVESFGVLSGGVQHAIAAGLCAERKLDDTALELLTQADASVTELVVPDCSHVSEEALVGALTRLTAPPPSLPGLSDVYNNSRVSGGGGGGSGGASTLLQLNPDDNDDSDDDDSCNPFGRRAGAWTAPRLTLVDLGFCGRPFTAKAATLLYPLKSLETLRLHGCFRLSNPTLINLMKERGEGLVELAISGNSQLAANGLSAIADTCKNLQSLRLEDCDQLPPDALMPLSKLTKLHTLSLGGIFLLNDSTLVALTDACKETLHTLCLRNCSLLTPEGLVTVART